MYIHTIRSGQAKQYVRRLLRIGRREGARRRNYTLLNLSHWTEERLAELQSALQEKRQYRGTILEREADTRILKIVSQEYEGLDLVWRIHSILSGRTPKRHRDANGRFASRSNLRPLEHSVPASVRYDDAQCSNCGKGVSLKLPSKNQCNCGNYTPIGGNFVPDGFGYRCFT